MSMVAGRLVAAAAWAWGGCLLLNPVLAGADPRVRTLAATCSACHGTDGHAVAGVAGLRLAGRSKADFVRLMRGFRDGTRAATVMQQIAKGYDNEQIDALGDYFAAQR